MMGGAEWPQPPLRRDEPVPHGVEPHRRARPGRVRAPVARHHRPRLDLERRVRRARVAAARRRPHHRRADRAHAGRRPVRHHGVLPRAARGLPVAAPRDPALGHELGPARAREVGDLPLAVAAVRGELRVPRARGGVGPPPARRRLRQLGAVGRDHARPPRQQGGVGVALPQPRRGRCPTRRAPCSRPKVSTRR